MENPPLSENSLDREFSISLERLLFGAIALNLIYLMCFATYLGGYLVLTITYFLFTHYLRGLTLFALGVGGLAIVSQLAQFFAWGVRGFTEGRPFRIVIVGIFFTLYGVSGVKTGIVDGYAVLGTVGITSLVVIFAHWQQVLSRVRKPLR